MGDFCCHENQSFDPICLKTLCSLSPTPVMPHIKFDQDWPTGFIDIQVWKCGRRRTTDGRRTDDGPLVYFKLTFRAFGSGELKKQKHLTCREQDLPQMQPTGSRTQSSEPLQVPPTKDAATEVSMKYWLHIQVTYEPRHDKTNEMSVSPAKTQISLGIRPVWSVSSLSALGDLGSLATHWAHSEDSDQTRRMPRLIRVFAGRTLILLVLSCRGSYVLSAVLSLIFSTRFFVLFIVQHELYLVDLLSFFIINFVHYDLKNLNPAAEASL